MEKTLLVFIVGIFANISLANTLSLVEMPQYQVKFEIKRSPYWVAGPQYGYLYLRYYQNFGDGSSTGWEKPINLPRATLDGEVLPLSLSFSYSDTCIQGVDPYCALYKNGSSYTYDQFAQYVKVQFPLSKDTSELIITGTYQQVAYFSAMLYTLGTYSDPYTGHKVLSQQEIMDKDMVTLNGKKNPTVTGNPSVFAYPAETTQLRSDVFSSQFSAMSTQNKYIVADKLIKNLPVAKDRSNGRVDFYRLDKVDSSLNIDEIASDGCSQGYLVATNNSILRPFQISLLRMKVPTTFISNNIPDKVFGNYQSRYFSVSVTTSVSGSFESLPSYWTVNARMLNDYVDSQGYAYIFFAPQWFVSALALEENTPSAQPPVLSWGKYKGYVLNISGRGDLLELRYRIPDPHFQGSPANAVCYATPEEQQPVNKTELGDFTPEMFGSNMADFKNGNIGAVNKNLPWPISKH